MAHYAYINSNNEVVAVIVGKDETELIDGLDTETYYALGTEYTVKRTSYNAATNGFRGTYAGIGCSYNSDEDIFITPQPYPSWIRSGSFWNAPTPMPTDDKRYTWDEATTSWVEVE
jgi:hypothetical protein